MASELPDCVIDQFDEPPTDAEDGLEPPSDLDHSAPPPRPTTTPKPQPPSPQLKQAQLKQSTLIAAFAQIQPEQYLPQLNPAQRRAVQAKVDGGLQILAGPGSGKTKVVTTRVAYLLQHYGLPPEDVIVVTFTNKAANEMKHRIALMLGNQAVDKLVMGTFHSVCVRYLRKYGRLVGLPNNFVIADRDAALSILKRLKPTSLDEFRADLKPSKLLELISSCKSRNMSPGLYRRSAARAKGAEAASRIDAVADVYELYQEELEAVQAVDFDDILLYGLKLVTNHPKVVRNVKSVLIDEFQDTNVTQYEIVKRFAESSGSLTIVGDPDQSIYGWRNAEVENLDKMLVEFHPVQQVFLEQNYRSTGAILGAALAVVKQDKARIDKGLVPTHPTGSSVVLHAAASAHQEADHIAAQIKHLIAHTGGMLGFSDFAVLVRYSALSLNIERALQRNGIPSRMVGGHKFFERAEIRDMLAYLQLIDNPDYTPAFTRAVATPKRGVGDKSIVDLIAQAKAKGTSVFELAAKSNKQALKSFTQLVKLLRERALKGTPVTELLASLCDELNYKQHLEKTDPTGFADRWENIEELKAYAVSVQEENPEGLPLEATALDSDGEDLVTVPNGGKGEGEHLNHLGTFLAISMLATDTDTDASKEDAKNPKVTLSTCHSAKGLEWPVVFVPACEEGVYPFYRASGSSNEIDEERRLLYVAITRAQAFCCMSSAKQRQRGADLQDCKLSPFLSGVAEKYPTLFVQKLQKITDKTRREVASVLGREPIGEELVAEAVRKHEATLPLNAAGSFAPPGAWPSRSSTPTPADAGFKSALSSRVLNGHHSMTTQVYKGSTSTQPAPKGFNSLGGGRMGMSMGRTLGSAPFSAGSSREPSPANYATKLNQASAALGAKSRALSSENLSNGGSSTMRPFKRPRFNAPRTSTPPRPGPVPGSVRVNGADVEQARLLAEAEEEPAAVPLFRPASTSPPLEAAVARPTATMTTNTTTNTTTGSRLDLPETRRSRGVRGVMRFPLPPPPEGEVRLTNQNSLLQEFARMDQAALSESRLRDESAAGATKVGGGGGQGQAQAWGQGVGKSAAEVLTLSDSD